MPTLLAVFDQPASAADAAKRLKDRGYTDMEIYSPAAFRELEEVLDQKPSRVRLFTLIGGLTGVVTGYAMTFSIAPRFDQTALVLPAGGRAGVARGLRGLSPARG